MFDSKVSPRIAGSELAEMYIMHDFVRWNMVTVAITKVTAHFAVWVKHFLFTLPLNDVHRALTCR